MCTDQSHADFGPGQMHSLKIWNFGCNFTRALYDDYYSFHNFGSFICFMTGISTILWISLILHTHWLQKCYWKQYTERLKDLSTGPNINSQ